MEALYLEFENMPVRIVATRKIPEIKTPGLDVKGAEAGTELTVNLWVAWELIETGLARLSDGGVSDEEWTQIHFRERVQPLGQPTPLPKDFYPRVYITFKEAMRTAGDEGRQAASGRMKGRYRDIVESRITKIMRLAGAEVKADSRGLQSEESVLYNELHNIIERWRSKMRELGGESSIG
ncbi:MAG: DNA replication complex GINS family protein [Candidatus Bathyarchaeota archaeon]|nr:MAG: DNA replication complex GINS family protein [Candidatus Bathyarchaeota archaeon]